MTDYIPPCEPTWTGEYHSHMVPYVVYPGTEGFTPAYALVWADGHQDAQEEAEALAGERLAEDEALVTRRVDSAWARKVLLPEHIREADHVLLDTDDEEPIWSTADDALVNGTFSADELATAQVLECVIDLDSHLGHYITAAWLQAAADLLEAIQLDTATYGLDRPENFELRDRVENAKGDAREAADAYYNDDDDDPNASDAVFHIADHVVEPLLDDLGYVTQAGNMGYQTFRIIKGETT